MEEQNAPREASGASSGESAARFEASTRFQYSAQTTDNNSRREKTMTQASQQTQTVDRDPVDLRFGAGKTAVRLPSTTRKSRVMRRSSARQPSTSVSGSFQADSRLCKTASGILPVMPAGPM